MPELPDLDAIAEFLQPRLLGQTLTAFEMPRPIVFRDLTGAGSQATLVGRRLAAVRRRAKFLVFEFGEGRLLAINPMLAGELHYCDPDARRLARTYLILRWSSGKELRYVDPRSMGKIYLTRRLEDIPTLLETGPEPLSDELTLDLFRQRLRQHHGEIKGILVNHRFVAGIGNAYADEILFRAGLYPFRRRTTLSEQEIATLYRAMRDVLIEARETVRQRMGEEIQTKIRDFLAVHRRGGSPCPCCGTIISEITAHQRITSFCRHCQPGTLVR